MLAAIGRAPAGPPCVCLLLSWTRLAHYYAGRRTLAHRVLATGASIETTSGDRLTPDGRGSGVGRITAGSVLL
jgi:hypothetical protein